MDRAHLGEAPQDVDEVAGLEALAGRRHEHDERLPGVAPLADDEVAEVPGPRLLVVRLEPFLASPVANREPDRIPDIGGQEAHLDPDDLVPPAGTMEAEIDPPACS